MAKRKQSALSMKEKGCKYRYDNRAVKVKATDCYSRCYNKGICSQPKRKHE